MTIKLSDYMLEQAVSDAEVSDIVSEQAFACIEVSAAIANAYAKQLMMEQYIMEADETETKTEESSETGEKKSFKEKIGGFFKAIGKAIANFFKFIGEKLKDFWNWITRKNKKIEDALDEAAESDEAAEIIIEKFEVTDNDTLTALGVTTNEALTDKSSKELKAQVVCQIFDVKAITAFLSKVGEISNVRDLTYNVVTACRNMKDTVAIGRSVKELTPVLEQYIKDVSGPIVKEGRPKGVSAKQAVNNMRDFLDYAYSGAFNKTINNAISECNTLTDWFNEIFNAIGGKYNESGNLVSENGYNGGIYKPLMRVSKLLQETAIDVKKKLTSIPKICQSISEAVLKYDAAKRDKDKLRETMYGSNKTNSSNGDNEERSLKDKLKDKYKPSEKKPEKEFKSSNNSDESDNKYKGGYEAPKFV